MKQLLGISFWMVSILLLAVILTSLGYRFVEALFVSTLFLPGALAFKFLFPKISFEDKTTGIKNVVFLTMGIMVAEVLFFLIAHMYICHFRDEMAIFCDWPEIPSLLTNPVFLALILTSLAVGNYFFETWIGKKYPDVQKPITFISDRKHITLPPDDILYVESNDSVTTVVATENRSYRNKTPISQWEAILEPHFIRVHRSYLVNKSKISGVDIDTISVDGIQLPVSRKYKHIVRHCAQNS